MAMNICDTTHVDVQKNGCIIGLNDKTEEAGSNKFGWKFTDNTSQLSYENWDPGEPNDFDYLTVRGEILGFVKDGLLRKHLPRMFSLIKNES